jgi:hypothetical protein
VLLLLVLVMGRVLGWVLALLLLLGLVLLLLGGVVVA